VLSYCWFVLALTCINSLSSCCCPWLTDPQPPLLPGGDPGGLLAPSCNRSLPLLGGRSGKLPIENLLARPAQRDQPELPGLAWPCLVSAVPGRLLPLLLLLPEDPPALAAPEVSSWGLSWGPRDLGLLRAPAVLGLCIRRCASCRRTLVVAALLLTSAAAMPGVMLCDALRLRPAGQVLWL
jgi:hypothetical protein